MIVLMAHNYYQTANPSGENISFEAEVALLREHGHRVVTYTRHSDEIRVDGLRHKLMAGTKAIWDRDTYLDLRRLLHEARPDIVHLQNIFPLISASPYNACQQAKVPIVQTLRNYRLLCLNGLFFRDGHTCELCLRKAVPWPGVLYACYRQDRAASAAGAAALVAQRRVQSRTQAVAVYIVLTEFARQKFMQGGFLREKLMVKPNFVHPDPRPGQGQGHYALFVGRLSLEKGLAGLPSGWERVGRRA